MTTAKELREHCDKLRSKREEDLKSILNDYFESSFIEAHRPWRAVIGNKRCKPIPIHRDFYSSDATSFCREFKWPNLSEDLLRKELEELGFVITEHRISLTVPACEKGKKLTFAQEWVKKINSSYSQYCLNEKKKANELYSEFISKLHSTSAESVKTYEGYTLFEGFKFETEISAKCATYIRALMSHDGIEEYYEDGKYKGVRVLQQPPN